MIVVYCNREKMLYILVHEVLCRSIKIDLPTDIFKMWAEELDALYYEEYNQMI